MSTNPGGINNFTAIQNFVDGQTTGELTSGENSGDTVSLVLNDVTVGSDGNPEVAVDGEVVAVVTNNAGVVTLANLPTEDPGVAGQLYNDSGTLMVSAG